MVGLHGGVFSSRQRLKFFTDKCQSSTSMAMPRVMWFGAHLSLWSLRFDPRCLHEICVGQSGTETGFPPSASVTFLAASFHQCSTSHLHYMLLLPEEEMGEAWDPPKKQYSFGNKRVLNRKVISLYLSLCSIPIFIR